MDSPRRQPKLRSLEIGRFIAATLVVLSHLGPTVAQYGVVAPDSFLNTFRPGTFAVQYFFVLSGFVMATAHANDFGRVRAIPHFLWRRACRIYPLYWLAVLIPFYFQFHNISPTMAFRFLSLAPPIGTSELLPQTWTLRFEVAFYLGFSLCLLPYVGRPLLAIWLILGFWLDNSFLFKQDHLFHPSSYFVFGVIAGLAFPKITIPKTKCLIAVILSAVAVASSVIINRWVTPNAGPDFEYLIAAAVSVLVLSLALAETSGLFNIGKIATTLGAMSYPIYVFHWTVFIIFNYFFYSEHLTTIGLYGLYAAGFITIYFLSWLLTFGFDRPVQKFLRRGFLPGRSLPLAPSSNP